ncbi:hypothetical protein BS47DRAFT_1341559 [Hydnum rufescens UP504]|uniref:Uncharacterized protein n=1 Tax=Hydnum rufescens UP504 TaxID=1448309 RepID=A0A9P6B1U7_9AGAM|nr:hypothetical protein BS47DRAFT_1341559 [Hydnum rufescens UP504]
MTIPRLGMSLLRYLLPKNGPGAAAGRASDPSPTWEMRSNASRARSIVSSKSPSHSQNLLASFSPPLSSSSTSSHASAFGSGNLPHRPSTASALEPPPPIQRTNPREAQTYQQPVPIPPDPSPQPFNNQSRLQYALQVSPPPQIVYGRI